MSDESSIVVLTTDRLVLELPRPDDAPRVLRFVARNREHLAPWEPSRRPEYFTVEHWRAALAANRRAAAAGESLRTFVALRSDGEAGDALPVIGCVNVNMITRGAFHCGTLGYSINVGHEGRGLMHEALAGMVAHAFTQPTEGGLGLHRLQANYQPQNTRSAALLGRLGFVEEGGARDYLYLAGAWRDHVLTSLTNPEWSPPSP